MSVDFELQVEARQQLGTGYCRRLRRENKVPLVIYGAGKPSQALTTDHDTFMHKLEVEAFHSAIIQVRSGRGMEQAILRDVQMHPYKPRILHADFMRVKASEKLTMRVPLHFTGEDEAPGVKMDAGIVSHLMNDVEIVCLPKDLPEYLELDCTQVGINESLHLSDIKLPDGVELIALTQEDAADLAVFAIVPPKLEVEEEEIEEGEALEEGVEREAGEEGEGEEESD